MEFSGGGSHIIMQSFEQNGDIFGFQQANPNSNVQGLSLSLYNPMDIVSHQEQLFMDDGSGRLNLFQSPVHHEHSQQQQAFVLKRSKYVIPAQQLLNEFCNIGNINRDNNNESSKKKKEHKGIWNEGGSASPLYLMDLVELQRRKAKLQSMLEEVHRRYRRYCDEMRSVVSAFEAIAGENSANVYASLASKAMSRHFRCLKDGITGQLQVTKMALGERDGNSSSNNAIAPGTTRGETPRLKRLEQCLRQQKAFHQAAIMESQPWRPQRGLPERSVSVLRAWLFEHFLHPYPSDVDKHILARQTGLSRSQVSNWFINARVRLWKPMVEEMYLEELKEEGNLNPSRGPSSSQVQLEDQKPVPGFHINNDTDSLSSIINNNRNPNPNNNFGVVDLDFSSYNASNDVSLTLGLQQQERSLLFSREEEEEDDDRGVHFSILDDEGQNLMQHRNFMGSQLLHDQHLPGRTDNEIKNYWRTRVQKHAKQLKCDVNSKQFQDVMRYLWMPRLLEKIRAASNSSGSTSLYASSAPQPGVAVNPVYGQVLNPSPEYSYDSSSVTAAGVENKGCDGAQVNRYDECWWNNEALVSPVGYAHHQGFVEQSEMFGNYGDFNENLWTLEDNWLIQ